MGTRVRSRPSQLTVPVAVGSSPAIARSSVDLPLPEGPRTASTAPSGTSMVASQDRGHAVEGHGDVGEAQHHQAPSAGTRNRSTASITSAVTPASTTEAASAIP